MSDGQLWRILVGWLLWLLLTSFLLRLFWRWSADRKWHAALRITAVLIVVSAFLAGAFYLVRLTLMPSFVYVSPGVLLNGDTWDFIVQHRGKESLYNVEIFFMDLDKADELSKKKEISINDIKSEQLILKYSEVNPKGKGSIFATQFQWKPFRLEKSHFSIVITSRTGQFDEDLKIARVQGKWLYRMIVTDANTKRVLVSCRDKDFPDIEGQELKPCFPEMSLPEE